MRKEAQVRRLKKKAKPGSSETAKRLEIPEACKYSQERIKTAQKKKSKRNTRNRGLARPSQVSNDPARKRRKKLGATSHSASGWHLREPK